MNTFRCLALLLPFTGQAWANETVDFSAFASTDLSQVLSDNTNDDTSLRSLAGVGLSITLSEQWRVYGSFQTFRGDNGNAVTEDIQVYSNIDTPPFTGLFDAWVEGRFNASGTRVKLGQFDANSEFAVASHAQAFINSSMGFSPTITFLPTYPAPTLGISVEQSLTQRLSVVAGFFSDEDNQFEQVFSIAEGVWQHQALTLKAGVWHWSGDIQQPRNNHHATSTRGIYWVSEGALSMPATVSDDTHWYVQAGWSEADYNPIRLHAGIGIEASEMFGNPAHGAGIGITHVDISADYFSPEQHTATTETALEIFYSYQLSSNIEIKPDLQLIISPALAPNRDQVMVATMRLDIVL